MDTLQFIINILVLVIWFCVGGALGLLVFAPLEVWLHEFGHFIAIHKARESTPLYAGPLQIKITHSNKWVTRQGYTASPYLGFLAEEPMRYKEQIRAIAKAGVQFSSIVGLILFFLFSVPALLISTTLLAYLPLVLRVVLVYLPMIIGGVGASFVIRAQISYRSSDRGMCDKNIVKHPEKYMYYETPSWDEDER